VLAPNAGGPRDLVKPGRTGYLLSDDPAELRAAVENLRDPVLRKRFGRAARPSVAGRTWSAICTELMGHYDAVQSPEQRRAA
jgi:phosphatidylinositol alpha 1,6-mannosyltransferase